MVELDDLVCFHGTPRSNTEALLATTPEAEMARMLGRYTQTVLAGGHTHIAMLRRHGPSLVVNPGSVGMPFEAAADGGAFRNPPWAEYAIVDGRAGRVPAGARRRGRGDGGGVCEWDAARRVVGAGLGVDVMGPASADRLKPDPSRTLKASSAPKPI